MSFLNKIFGDANERYLKSVRLLVEEINKFEWPFEKFSGEEIKGSVNWIFGITPLIPIKSMNIPPFPNSHAYAKASQWHLRASAEIPSIRALQI